MISIADPSGVNWTVVVYEKQRVLTEIPHGFYIPFDWECVCPVWKEEAQYEGFTNHLKILSERIIFVSRFCLFPGDADIETTSSYYEEGQLFG